METTNINFDRDQILSLIKRYYLLQEHRIAMGGQIRALKDQDKPTEMLESYFERFHGIEKDIAKYIAAQIKQHPMWEWFDDVKGIGPILAGALISTIDIEQAQHASSVWQYAGLAPDQKRKKGQKISWNPFLKMTCFKIGESFVKTKGEYRKIYETSRMFYDNKFPEEVKEGKRVLYTKGHRHAMARRRCVKLFLSDMWVVWRQKYDLPISEPFMHRGKP